MATPFDEPQAPSPSLADGIDNPAKDVPRLQPKDLMIDAMLGQMFKQIDQRKRFDPFYLDDENNAGPGSFDVPGNDAQLTNVFDRYTDQSMAPPGPMMPGSGGAPDPSGSDPSAPSGGNPFDIGGGEQGMPVTPPDQRVSPMGPDRSGDFSPNLDPYGSDMREALRRIVRNA